VRPGVHVFAFSEHRDEATLEAFAKTFVAVAEMGPERPVKAILLDDSTDWRAPTNDQWVEFDNVREAFSYGLANPTASFTMYLDAKKGAKATHTLITFTKDRNVVFGLSLPLPESKVSEDGRIPLVARKLMAVTKAPFYTFGVDAPPPINRGEFAAMGAHS
jgi:hypothetical protein